MRIAIVDDENIWQRQIEEEIKKYSWKESIEIDVFSSGEALNYKKEYNIIFLDIEMK